MKDEIFFDTNIICYAFDLNEPAKKEVCEKLIKKVMGGETVGVVSNQVLGEVFNLATRKLGISPDKVRIIIDTIIESKKWRKINYTEGTIAKAAQNFELFGTHFWDLVIAETMKENGVEEIFTENEKDFKASEVVVKNPFK